MNKICDCIPDNCDRCYSLQVPYNPLLITVDVGLVPGAQYYLWVSDMFENLYYDFITVASNNTITINAANFPKGLFNSNSGKLTVFLSSDLQGVLIAQMSINGTSWNCISTTISEPIYFINEKGCRLFINEDDKELFIKE